MGTDYRCPVGPITVSRLFESRETLYLISIKESFALEKPWGFFKLSVSQTLNGGARGALAALICGGDHRLTTLNTSCSCRVTRVRAVSWEDAFQ